MIFLDENEKLGIITLNGSFCGVWARNERDVLPIADIIRDIMARLLSEKKHDDIDYNDGIWIWKFSKDLETVTGQYFDSDE